MAVVLQAASREALAEASVLLDAYVDTARAADLARLGDELFAFVRLLVAERPLRRVLGDPSTPEQARTRLVEQVLGGQLAEPTLELVRALVRSRWSRSLDLIDAAETLARRATLGPAEKDGTLDDVEDELFRFGRLLAREPELEGLLSDEASPAEGRVGLLDRVLNGQASAVGTALLRQSVRLPRGRHLDVVAEEQGRAWPRRAGTVRRPRPQPRSALTPPQGKHALSRHLTRLLRAPRCPADRAWTSTSSGDCRPRSAESSSTVPSPPASPPPSVPIPS
jgi:F-type H+-transporting ATPase subunit delta